MDDVTPTPKLCECGCGLLAPIPTETCRTQGRIKGQPLRFRVGHAGRGKPMSAEARAKLSETISGDGHWNWRGDAAGYDALHHYLREYFPKAQICEECGKQGPTDYALICGREYSRNREDYQELCRRCHLRYDGILKLEEADLTEIKAMREQGYAQQQIADRFGISNSHVSRTLKKMGFPPRQRHRPLILPDQGGSPQ